MTIAEQKAAQRKAGIAARRALSEADRTSANAALCARIAGLDCFRTAQNILLYAAFGAKPTSPRWPDRPQHRAKYWHGPSAARVSH